jgi:hypothetical protein
MASNIISLIRKDFYALWTEKGVGSIIYTLLVIGSLCTPALKLINMLYLLILIPMYIINSFTLDEKYRTGLFFASMPVRRIDIVLSRYLGILIIMLIHLALGYASNLIFKLTGISRFSLLPGYYAVALIFSSIIASIYLPFYFRYGITKAMNIISSAFIGLFYGIMFVLFEKQGLLKEIIDFTFTNVFTTSLLLICVSILLFVISIRISSTIYLKRDI